MTLHEENFREADPSYNLEFRTLLTGIVCEVQRSRVLKYSEDLSQLIRDEGFVVDLLGLPKPTQILSAYWLEDRDRMVCDVLREIGPRPGLGWTLEPLNPDSPMETSNVAWMCLTPRCVCAQMSVGVLACDCEMGGHDFRASLGLNGLFDALIHERILMAWNRVV